MSEHTPGLLTYEPAYKQGFVIWGGSNSIPVEIVSSCDDEGRWGAIKDVANARRLVAAWNACEGIPTEDLEACPDGGLLHLADHTNQLAIERDSLRAVNAELLEALEGVIPYMEAAESAWLVGDEGCHWPVEFVRAAITKARAMEGETE